MFWKEKKFKFSIRKLNVGIASTIIGMTLSASQFVDSVKADTNGEQHYVSAQYLAESELTSYEKSLIKKHAPNEKAGEYQTYYMVYRQRQNVLPATGSQKNQWAMVAVGGLILIGVARLKGRQKHVITSIVLISAFGYSTSVAALSGTLLSTFNNRQTIKVGDALPDLVIAIDQYDFVGYIPKKDLDETLESSTDDENKSLQEQSVKPPIEKAPNLGLVTGGTKVNHEQSAYQASNELAPKESSEETTKAPASQPVIPLVTTSEETIPFEVLYQDDATLLSGTERVEQVGSNGKKRLTYVDGVLKQEELLQAPIAQVIRRGTQLASQNNPIETPETTTPPSTNKEEIVTGDASDSAVPTQPSEDLPAQPDSVVEETPDTPVTEVSQPTVTETSVPQPIVPEITTTEEVIPFETSYQDDENLLVGTEVVEQVGVNGKKRLTYTDGVLTQEEVLQQPVVQVIHRGTKPASQPLPTEVPKTDETVADITTPESSSEEKTSDVSSQPIIVSEEVIPFDVEYQDDPELAFGKEEILQVGQDGLKKISTQDGRIVEETLVTAAQSQIIRRGTKIAPTITEVYQRIAYQVTYQDDPNLTVGKETILLAGIDGKRRLTYTNGILTRDDVIEAPVNEIILRGTKPLPVVRTEEVEAAFERLYEDDPTVYVGEERQKQAGKVGLERVTYTDDVETNREVLTAPVNEIILRGTKPLPVVRTEEVEIAFEKISEPDSSLLEGESNISQQGVNGKKRLTYTDGILTEEVILEQAIPEITRYGTLRIDKTHLMALLEKARLVSEGDFSTSSWQTLQEAVIEGEKILETPLRQQEPINQASERLQVALAQLSVDKTVLEALLDEAKQKVETDYSVSSWATFNQQKTLAQLVFASSDSKQDEIDQSVKALKQALTSLTVDTANLELLLAQATQKIARDYTTESWKTLKEIEAISRDYLATSNLQQSHIDTLATQLQEAIEGLVPYQETKPSLLLKTLQQDDLDKTVTLHYDLVDPDHLYQSAILKVYDGDALVASYPIAELSELEIRLPEYETTYRLETSFTYLDYGKAVTETLAPKEVTLALKAIEIKDIDSLALYHYQNGELTRSTTLSSLPSDSSSYFVRVQSDRFRDMLLPIANIKEVTLDNGKIAYQVVTDVQELVQDRDLSSKSLYEKQLTFTVPKTPVEANVYTSFKDLLEAMAANPSGHFVLGADLFADDVVTPANQLAYLNETFTGRLSGQYGNQQFAIYNLEKPLFKFITNATIEHLDLKQVTIATSNVEVGALASWAFTSTVKDVSALGYITAPRDIGGLVYMSSASTFDNTSFVGSITATANSGSSNVGGIAGAVSRGTVKNSYVNADIRVTANDDTARTGGIVGYTNGTSATDTFNIVNVYARGHLSNEGSGGVTGGIVGSTEGYDPGRVKNAVSAMTLDNANDVYGYSSVMSDRMIKLLRQSTDTHQSTQQYVTLVTTAQANDAIATFPITTSAFDSGQYTESQRLETDYLSLAKATADHAIAYRNMERLIPFYNKEIIVKYGNLVPVDDKLNQVDLLSVTPMIGETIISDVAEHKQDINRLLLNYADGTTQYLAINYREDFRNTAISEYDIVGTALIYTPEQFLSHYETIVSQVLPDLQAVAYKSDDVARALGIDNSDSSYRDTMLDGLYLQETFEANKAHLATYLKQILATDKSINTASGVVQTYLIDYIKTNKAKLLMGLAYMTRWYNINFGDTNILDLATFNQDFFGKPVNTMEWLVSLASAGYDNLKASNNLLTYANYMSSNTGQVTLLDYLSHNRHLFTNYTDDNDWFKASTKAYIVEGSSNEVASQTARVYDRLSQTPSEQNGILPLLTAEEGIFILTNMTTITYGMFDRYMDMSLKETDPERYQTEVARLKEMADKAAMWQRDHMDFWHRIVLDNVKDKLIRTVPVWDGYRVRKEWLPKSGEKANQAIKDFFGPVGSRSDVANNGTGAYANGYKVAFVHDSVLTSYGNSVYTHEMVHNNDHAIYLGGYGRRLGVGAESYALGLLQSESIGGYSSTHMTLNTTFDHSDQVDSTRRYVNVSPERFQNAADVQSYLHGMLDVMYVLDYAEAQALLNQSAQAKKAWYGAFDNKYTYTSSGQKSHASDTIRDLTDQEVSALRSWEDLVDYNVTSVKGLTKGIEYHGNGYYTISLFTSNYAAMSNEYGAPGGLTFRRTAFELWAAKGYEQGFLPYASSKLLLSLTYKAPLNDQLIFNEVFGNDYQSWKDFKKAMFKERIDKLSQLSSITIDYFGPKTISRYEELQALIEEAVQNDIAKGLTGISGRSSYVQLLKMAIYNAYLRQTDDFKESIFLKTL